MSVAIRHLKAASRPLISRHLTLPAYHTGAIHPPLPTPPLLLQIVLTNLNFTTHPSDDRDSYVGHPLLSSYAQKRVGKTFVFI